MQRNLKKFRIKNLNKNILEVKGHYLNATAATSEEMIKRAACAKDFGVPIIMHDYLTGGFTTNTSLANYCRDNGLLLHQSN